MAPPEPVKPVSPAASGAAPLSPQEERNIHLHADQMVSDGRWKDSEFRQSQLKLYMALGALRKFMDGKGSEEDLKSKIDAWVASDAFKQDPAFSEGVLKGIYGQLAKLKGDENVQRAGEVKALLPADPTPPPAAPETPAPAEAAQGEKAEDDEEPAKVKFGAISLDIRAGDEALRPLPHYLTAKIIPLQGFNQNLTSVFSLKGAAEFSYKDFNFLAGAYQEDMTPTDSPAHYHRAGIRLGMVEYSNPMVGDRGPGGGFHFSLLGRKRLGMELGAAWCTGVDNSDISGVECPDASAQLGVFDHTDLLSMGYGPFEAGFSILPNAFYVQGEDLNLPGISRVPLSFHANWHFNPPPVPDDPQTPGEVADPNISNAEVTMTAFSLFGNTIGNNFRRKQEGAYELSRVLFFADKDQFALLNTGSMLGGIITGWIEGSMAQRLSRQLRYGNNGQRIGLGVLMGAELAGHIIGVAATPGMPDTIQTFPGQVVPEDADLSGNEGISDLQAHAFRLNAPGVAFRDGLAVLGAVGAFGNREKAITDGNLYYPIAHGVLSLGGLVMVLTSGNQSGTGFFGGSIIGNQPPNFESGERIELNDTGYSIADQRGQYYRLEFGSQMLSYGLNTLIDFGVGKIRYDRLKGCEEHPEPGCPGVEEAEEKQAWGPIVDPKIGVQASGEGFQLGLSGQF